MKKTKRHISFVFSILFTALIFLFPAYAAVDEVVISRDKDSKYQELHQIVNSRGKVNVIVKLEVPGIKELTAESHRFRIKKSRQGSSSKGIEADMALKESIDTAAYAVLNSLNGTRYQLNYIYSSIPYMALEVSANALAILESLPEVLYIKRNRRIKMVEPVENKQETKKVATTSPGLSKPMLDDTIGIIGANTAHDIGYTGSGWYVAVLDTGIRSTHEFFNGKHIVEACFALGEDGVGPAGDCPYNSTSWTGPGAAAHHPDTYAKSGHGTPVTGIAVGNNGTLFGVAKDANIIAVQVFSKMEDCSPTITGDQPCVITWDSDIAAGLQHVYSLAGTYILHR